MCPATEFCLMSLAERPAPGKSRVHWQSCPSTQLPTLFCTLGQTATTDGVLLQHTKTFAGAQAQMYTGHEVVWKVFII